MFCTTMITQTQRNISLRSTQAQGTHQHRQTLTLVKGKHMCSKPCHPLFVLFIKPWDASTPLSYNANKIRHLISLSAHSTDITSSKQRLISSTDSSVHILDAVAVNSSILTKLTSDDLAGTADGLAPEFPQLPTSTDVPVPAQLCCI